MSATLSQMTAAELVADLEKHRNTKDLGIRLAKLDVIAELDRRCEDAGIALVEKGGVIVFEYADKAYYQLNDIVWLGIPATEQHALEGYLLTKGGKG